jgi:hypothetical protein
VDGVVMTITRGQQGPLVDRAIRHLNEIGARLSGVVFNRATTKDFYRSAYASSSFRSLPGTAPRNRLADLEANGESQSRFGPLVQSVVTFMPEGSAR